MKKAILILALTTQAAFAGEANGQKTYVTQQIILNGQVAHILVPAGVVTKAKQPAVLRYASKKPAAKRDNSKGLRRSLLRSNFR